jgi:hypothetical protein
MNEKLLRAIPVPRRKARRIAVENRIIDGDSSSMPAALIHRLQFTTQATPMLVVRGALAWELCRPPEFSTCGD